MDYLINDLIDYTMEKQAGFSTNYREKRNARIKAARENDILAAEEKAAKNNMTVRRNLSRKGSVKSLTFIGKNGRPSSTWKTAALEDLCDYTMEKQAGIFKKIRTHIDASMDKTIARMKAEKETEDARIAGMTPNERKAEERAAELQRLHKLQYNQLLYNRWKD